MSCLPRRLLFRAGGDVVRPDGACGVPRALALQDSEGSLFPLPPRGHALQGSLHRLSAWWRDVLLLVLCVRPGPPPESRVTAQVSPPPCGFSCSARADSVAGVLLRSERRTINTCISRAPLTRLTYAGEAVFATQVPPQICL